MKSSVGIVIPAYRPDVERLQSYLTALEAHLEPERLHLELDNADPATVNRLAEGPASVNSVSHRRGKGAAITAGFERLDTEVLAFADADGSTSPPALNSVITAVSTGTADVAVGSRRHPKACVEAHQSRVRRRFGDLFVHVARALLPVQLYDYQCGAKAINAETWSTIRGELTAPGFAWDIDVLTTASLAGARIEEIPIVWRDESGSTVPPLRTTVALVGATLMAYHQTRCAAGSRWHRRLSDLPSPRQPLLQQSADKKRGRRERPP